MGGDVDMTNQPCRNCASGVYVETSIYDDMHGTLHCNVCGDKIERYLVGRIWDVSGEVKTQHVTPFTVDDAMRYAFFTNPIEIDGVNLSGTLFCDCGHGPCQTLEKCEGWGSHVFEKAVA